LSEAERALIAMIIALDGVRSDVRLLILDEVTAALPRNQAEPPGRNARKIRDWGSHGHPSPCRASWSRLDDDGVARTVAYEAEVRDIDEARLIEEMVGPTKEHAKFQPKASGPAVSGLSGPKASKSR
jgi:hypothetical protein